MSPLDWTVEDSQGEAAMLDRVGLLESELIE